MATGNKTLKKRAQAFAATHGLPYLTALKAVDEPLHRLRDITLWTRYRCAVTIGHFHLVGEKSILSSPSEFAGDDSQIWKSIHKRGLHSFSSSGGSFVLEAARRIELFRVHGVEEIWSYRQLHRAGLANGPQLEPLFHHYANVVGDRAGLSLIHHQGYRLGIYGVQMGGILKNRDERATIPIRLDELQALKEGRFNGELELPWGNWRTKDEEQFKFLNWTVEAHTLITSKARSLILARSNPSVAQVAILLGDGAGSVEEELDKLGLDPERFDVQDVRGGRLSYSLVSESLTIGLDRKVIFRNSTQNLLEIGEGFIEARPELQTEFSTNLPAIWDTESYSLPD